MNGHSDDIIKVEIVLVNTSRSSREVTKIFICCSAKLIVNSSNCRLDNSCIGTTVTTNVHIKSRIVYFKFKVWKMSVINDLVKLSNRV